MIIKTIMCGIFAVESFQENEQLIIEHWTQTKHRGPDNSSFVEKDGHFFGFHRLAINGLDKNGNQPFHYNKVILCCNGEIYNHNDLKQKYNINCHSNSDCEIILHLYQKIGIKDTISELSGYFAFILYDENLKQFFVGRDPFGVRSLYMAKTIHQTFQWSSEIKSLLPHDGSVFNFPQGHYWDSKTQIFHPYYNYSFEESIPSFSSIYLLLENAVKKRFMLEREFGVFLSGGLDSSIIAALVAKFSKTPIRTFAIGMKGSPDLHFAKVVADYIGSLHTEYIVSAQEMLDAIPNVIYTIETYDITTIRASIPMYLLSKYIRENTNIKVVFSGEGSDELSGSYLYFHNAPNDFEFQKECIHLLKNLSNYDCLRCDKTTAAWGLEVRTPFLDKEFTEQYMQISPSLKRPKNGIEKWFLRKCVENENLLPSSIIWRQKEAFSDGVSQKENSWYKVIHDFVSTHEINKNHVYDHNAPISQESLYYRQLFEQYYPNSCHLLKQFWMPKWTKTNDPSARELSVYEKN